LIASGAFQKGERLPVVLTYDQLNPDIRQLMEHLEGRKIDIVIDDGLHSDLAIQSTLESLRSLLADKFTYFIEDNSNTNSFLKIPEDTILHYFDEFSVLTRN
jgi:hypothetical protein